MISEFQLLSQKIEQLALLTTQLRSENAELRLQVSSLRAENTDAKERISYAYRQIAILIEKLPVEFDQPSEQAGDADQGQAKELANELANGLEPSNITAKGSA